MDKSWVRIWEERDIKEIEAHILIMGELSSDCGACREIGLDIKSTRQCPHCGTQFKYVTSRLVSAENRERYSAVRRIRQKCSDLVFVDYDDYKKHTSRSKLEDFLRG